MSKLSLRTMFTVSSLALTLLLFTSQNAFAQAQTDPAEDQAQAVLFSNTIEFLTAQKLLKSPAELLSANPGGFTGTSWSNKKTKLYGKFLEQEVAVSSVNEEIIASFTNSPRSYKERLQRARFILDTNQNITFTDTLFMNGVPAISSSAELKNQLDIGWSVLRGQEDNRTEFFLDGLNRIVLALIGERSSTLGSRAIRILSN